MSKLQKQLNIELWSVDKVCDWLKGIRQFTEFYLENFRIKQINGKKLTVLEFSDLNELVNSNLNHQIIIYKSIQNLLQLKYDLQNDTLQNLIFKTYNRLKCLLNYVERIKTCGEYDCENCIKFKQDLIKAASVLAICHRKLITWLVRLPFTKLKKFEIFRDEINIRMKNFLKIFRKKINENSFEDLKQIILDMMSVYGDTLEYCETKCDEENAKISVAFNYSYLDQVTLRKKFKEQELGLSLISLVEGVYTIAEIGRESAADECSKLNVEDDIIAINNQIIVGWDIYSINKSLKELYDSGTSVYLLLRKMPKDHMISIKQQQNQQKNRFQMQNENTIKKQPSNKSHQTQQQQQQQHQRKHSFSNIILTDDYLLDNSSDEEEDEEDDKEEERDFNNNNNKENLNEAINDIQNQNLYEKSTSKGLEKYSKKTSKLNSKSKAKNRLIRSMQNLLSYDRSRSASADSLSNFDSKVIKNSSKNSVLNDSSDSTNRLESIGNSNGKSDLIKAIFTNRKWDLMTKKQHLDNESPDTPNLINIKRIDSVKRSQSSSQSADETQIQTPKVSSKPPLNKRAYKVSQKPTMQGWLYKQKCPNLSSSTSNLFGSNNNLNTSGNNNNNNNNIIRNQINRVSKWKHYWCVLVKDYIAFYKYQDDKTPKDYLLLKDFTLVESETRKNGFILFDKTKQLEHEFYAESTDEFQGWYKFLTDRLKLNMEQMSQSTTSLSSTSGYDGTHHMDTSSNLQSQSLPSSSSLNRKNNLQLNLSTIIDSSDELVNNLNVNSIHVLSSSPKSSPTFLPNLQQSYNNSSRESSPGLSNKPSRDSSPSLAYPYMQETDNVDIDASIDNNTNVTTSESDVESHSKTLIAEKQDLIKDLNEKRKTQNVLNSRRSSAVNASISAVASAGLIRSSCSPSPSSATSHEAHFFNDEKTGQMDQQYHRANSLPGSLQFCVGSFITPSPNSKVSSDSLNKTQQNSSAFQNNQSVPSSSPISPTFNPNKDNKLTHLTNSTPNSPLLNKQIEANDQTNVQKYYYYQSYPHSQTKIQQGFEASPTSTNIAAMPQTRRISVVQVDANGVINTFNQPQQQSQVSSQNQPQQPFVIKTFNKSNPGIRKPPLSPTSNSNQASSSIVYRTEITILPSNNPSNNLIQPKTPSNNLPSAQNMHLSTSLPKYLSSSKEKIIRF